MAFGAIDLEIWVSTMLHKIKKIGSLGANWFIATGTYTGFCSMKQLRVSLLRLDRMLVHHTSLPCNLLRFPQQFASTHLYFWVASGTVRVKVAYCSFSET